MELFLMKTKDKDGLWITYFFIINIAEDVYT